MSDKKIFIAPASYDGRQILRKLLLKKKYKILGFLDNTKIRKRCIYKKIININKVNKLEFDKIFIGGRFYKIIFKQLIKLKVKKNKIILLPKSKFNFSKNLLKNRSVKTEKIFNIFLKITNNLKIDYFLYGSGLLAIFRKEPLAKYSDVDLLIKGNKLNLFLKEINKVKFVKITKRFIYKNKNKILVQVILESKKINQYEEPAILDIAGYFLKNGKIYIYTGGEKKKFLNRINFTKYEHLKYKKKIIKVPFKVKRYLIKEFGKNWIKPDDYFTEDPNFTIR